MASKLACAAMLLAAMAVFGVTSGIKAQTGGGYDLTWNTIASGGVMSATGNDYTLAGAAGQSDAGMIAGGGYTLNGGLWYDSTSRRYLPIVMR